MTRRIIPEHFAVYCDLGRLGMEAVVCPEETRSTIIDRLRRGDYVGQVRYILHIVDGLAIDETDSLIEAAEQLAREAA